MSVASNPYQWLVLGAGPAGVAVVGNLLENGIAPSEIIWVDPYFQSGDFGRLWGEVSGNTKVRDFLNYFNALKTFRNLLQKQHFPVFDKSLDSICLLGEIAEPLTWLTNQLRLKVNIHQGWVEQIENKGHTNIIAMKDGASIAAKKIVLCTGANPKYLDFPSAPQRIDLETALSPAKLAQAVDGNDRVAVFGSSHSAIIIIRQLHELGVQRIDNFYRNSLRFAVPMEGWTLYDNTGLKADTARWAIDTLCHNCPDHIVRHVSNEQNIQRFLPECSKVIYATGFERRSPSFSAIDANQYDCFTGIIAPGVFGAGLAYPLKIRTPLGDSEFDIGLWKFMKGMQKVLPIWLKYP
ncbi:FAD-dependent oxidoreductase [Vibrio sp. S4M6]|uniref:FAD-dependent oxidoreductase n=1 Tax=Vibrio sinus TaxID=2946865 RepID=UPI002029BE65|nr:FAD-dependent oxidoreductase [Vibrio sinus]MCL9781727.1 FAD-dependent oxidoreductase [Vibrio sinus]